MEIVFAKEGIIFRKEVEFPMGSKIVEDKMAYPTNPLEMTITVTKIEPIIENGTLKAIKLHARDFYIPKKQEEQEGRPDPRRLQKIRAADKHGQKVIDRIIRPLQPIGPKSEIVRRIEEMDIAHGGYASYIIDGLLYLNRIRKLSDRKYIANE